MSKLYFTFHNIYFEIRVNQYSFCIPINFNNLLKACFSNKKYLITIQTPPTQIEMIIFLIEKLILKIIGVQNQLPITFFSNLVCNKILNLEIQPQHTRISNL